MFIKSFEYEDLRTGWKLERTEFDAFNLLVGNSGVGKTKILRALTEITRFAFTSAETLSASWRLEFHHADQDYTWSGRIEQVEPKPHGFTFPRIVHEEIVVGFSTILFERGEAGSIFKGSLLPHISDDLSGLRLLSRERDIQSILHALDGIAVSSSIPSEPLRTRRPLQQLGLTGLAGPAVHHQGEPLHSIEVGWVVYKYRPAVWADIENAFASIFPGVEKLEVHARSEDEETVIELRLRERSAKAPIVHESISSGMRRTLGHLIEIFTAPQQSVILIDEFENSLGSNCMPEVVRLLHSRPDLQFIVTSHHPYVINNIPKDTWKLVQRRGSTVRVTSARDIPALQDASHHQAYLRLANLPEFEEGIA